MLAMEMNTEKNGQITLDNAMHHIIKDRKFKWSQGAFETQTLCLPSE